MQTDTYYIGWDVGGWNCDRNRDSRDAVVILDSKPALTGTPWRGNLRTIINEATNTREWLKKLFALCHTDLSAEPARIILAIDTPLGFSKAFTRLITRLEEDGQIGQSNTNPYLFRQTEKFLFSHGLTPLSAIKDMIGSQATKGMHVLAKFAPNVKQCGVWTDGNLLTVIEAYPAACKGSATIKELRRHFSPVGHDDKEDALTCALIAHLFAEKSELLNSPADGVPSSEGWIWVPKDGLQ